MIEIEGEKYYNLREVASLAGKSEQTVRLWEKWSNDREMKRLKRLIPKSIPLGPHKAKHWSESDAGMIVQFSKSMGYGSIASRIRASYAREPNKRRR